MFSFYQYNDNLIRVNDFVRIIAIGKIPFAFECGFKQNGEYRVVDVGMEFGDLYITILNHQNNKVLHIYEENLQWVRKVSTHNNKLNNNKIKYVPQSEIRELIETLESMNKERELDRALLENNKALYDKLTGGDTSE